MAKKTQAAMEFDGPPIPTLYTRPAEGNTRERLDDGWLVKNSAGEVVFRGKTFAEAEGFIGEKVKAFFAARDKPADAA
jgi:hypothetical protein